MESGEEAFQRVSHATHQLGASLGHGSGRATEDSLIHPWETAWTIQLITHLAIAAATTIAASYHERGWISKLDAAYLAAAESILHAVATSHAFGKPDEPRGFRATASNEQLIHAVPATSVRVAAYYALTVASASASAAAAVAVAATVCADELKHLILEGE